MNCFRSKLVPFISISDSNKIVHLKDVFQNQHEIVLVLEYAPGGKCICVKNFVFVLDDQYRNPNMNSKDHLVGQLTRSRYEMCLRMPS